jgi:plastocyanin
MPQPSFIGPQGSKFGLMKRALPFLVAIGLLTSCGGGTSAPAETLPAGAMVVKAVSGLRFDAAEYGPVKAGEVLIGYSNEDSVRHTLILAKDNTKVANFKLVVGTPGSVDSATVNLDAGTYQVICDVPGHGNMRATLIVE